MKLNKYRTSRMLWILAFQVGLFLSWMVMAASAADISSASLRCDSPTASGLPLEIDGEGDFCHVISGDISYINSWNMQSVEINGVEYTNTWSNKMPARVDGKYYIHYVGLFPWSHLEVIGGGESVPVTGITIDPTQMTMEIGDAAPLAAHIIPDNATEKSVGWLSGDTRIATVNAQGIVKGVSEGTVTITATTVDGGFESTSEVLVKESIDPSEKKHTLTITVNGAGSTTPAQGTYTYAEGTSVSVTASAADGATFNVWSGAAIGKENPIKLTMNKNLTLTANFSGHPDLPEECSGICNAATPVNPTVFSDGGYGNVTMYSTAPSSGGACNYGTTNVNYYAAINVNVKPGDQNGQWQGGTACGQCAEITVITSQGPKTVVARIMDKCPDANCGIDLGGAAPGEVMVDGPGRYEGKWRFVSCDEHPEVSDGPPSLDVLNGSNRWWSRVHVRNGSMAVDSIEWQTVDGRKIGTFPLAADPENAYEVPVKEVLQSNASSFLITVYYIDGTKAKINLSPIQLGTSGASYPLD